MVDRSEGNPERTYTGAEKSSLSNDIDADLKEDFGRAAQGSDFHQKTILSALIDRVLDQDEHGRMIIDESIIENELDKWGDIY